MRSFNTIMWERVFELAGENHEFFDTHRRGAKWMSEWLCKPLNEFNSQPEQKTYMYNSSSKTFMTLHYGSDDFKFEEDVQKLRAAVILAYPDKDIRNNTSLTDADVNDFYYSTFNDVVVK